MQAWLKWSVIEPTDTDVYFRTRFSEISHNLAYSGDSLKWRTHLIGALGPFWKVWKTHLNGAPKIQNFDTEMCLKELKNEEKQTKTGEHQKKWKFT